MNKVKISQQAVQQAYGRDRMGEFKNRLEKVQKSKTSLSGEQGISPTDRWK